MTTRERVLAGIVGVSLVVGGGYVGVRKMYLGSLEDKDATRRNLQKKLNKMQADSRNIEAKARSLPGWAALSFDGDELRASAKVGATLTALVERAGLSLDNFSLQPLRGLRVRGAYKEIGRSIRVRGRMEHIVDFLYLLQQEPHLHRLENLSISPQAKTNEVDLQVRYITLVLENLDSKTKTDKLATTAPTDLDSEGRKLYDAIASRDLFRPYIQRQARPVAPRPTGPITVPKPRPIGSPKPRVTTPPPDPGRFKVVGLPELKSKKEVLVSDTATGQLRSYETGETLAGGTIALVDYRPLPRADNPQMLSPSRVILRVGPDYWAVELGQKLTQKRRLKRDQLPEKIRSLPSPAPGDKVKKNTSPER